MRNLAGVKSERIVGGEHLGRVDGTGTAGHLNRHGHDLDQYLAVDVVFLGLGRMVDYAIVAVAGDSDGDRHQFLYGSLDLALAGLRLGQSAKGHHGFLIRLEECHQAGIGGFEFVLWHISPPEISDGCAGAFLRPGGVRRV